jgi:hypothetical protein
MIITPPPFFILFFKLTTKATEKSSVVVDRVESIQGLKDQLGKCRNLLQNRAADPNMGNLYVLLPLSHSPPFAFWGLVFDG